MPGLAAGVAFLGIEMLAGQALWTFPQSIAQTIRLGSPTSEFDATQFALGVAIHLAFSISLGVLFAAFADLFRLAGGKLLAAAVLFMWAESAVSIWLVLHTFLPGTLPLLLGAVPFWASFVGRTTFGVVLAVAYSLLPRADGQR